MTSDFIDNLFMYLFTYRYVCGNQVRVENRGASLMILSWDVYQLPMICGIES